MLSPGLWYALSTSNMVNTRASLAGAAKFFPTTEPKQMAVSKE
jgi:hypothetical protein